MDEAEKAGSWQAGSCAALEDATDTRTAGLKEHAHALFRNVKPTLLEALRFVFELEIQFSSQQGGQFKRPTAFIFRASVRCWTLTKPF